MSCEVCGSDHPETTAFICPGWTDPGQLDDPRYLCPDCAKGDGAVRHCDIVGYGFRQAKRIAQRTSKQVVVIAALGGGVAIVEEVPKYSTVVRFTVQPDGTGSEDEVVA